MAKTLSKMLALGTKAPEFSLINIDGKKVNLDHNPSTSAYLVMFICNHCPYVVHIQETLSKICSEFQERNVSVFAINSNDIENYPQDSPDLMKEFAKENSFTFPYLFDDSQEVAKAYKAACTPDFFLFDAEKHLVYRGRMDESRPGNGIEVTGKNLKDAVDKLLSGQNISDDQHPSMGCNIKWKAGNQPT